MGSRFYIIVKLIALISLMNLTSPLLSADYDTEFWAGAETKWDLGNDVAIELSPEIRYYKNLSEIKGLLLNIGTFWKINDYLKFGTYYRKKFVGSDESDKFLSRDIYYGFLNCSYESYRFETSFRLRYQMEMKPDKNWDEEYVRARLKFDYNLIGDADPFAFIEYFYRLNYKYADQVDKYRVSIGLDVDTYKGQKISVYYLYQEEMIEKKPLNAHIVGVSYSFDFSTLEFF